MLTRTCPVCAAVQATIQAVQFHPNGQLMLTASMDKRLRLFQVDGVHNPKVQSVYFADMPLFNARFSVGGDEVVCVGRRPFFYTLDLRSGTTTKVPGIQGAPCRRGCPRARLHSSWAGCALPLLCRPRRAQLGEHGDLSLRPLHCILGQ